MSQNNESNNVDLFSEDWRACLEAHYRHVVVEKDVNNEKTLITVLHDTGFDDMQITDMRRRILVEIGEPEPEPTIQTISNVPSESIEEIATVEIPAPIEIMLEVVPPQLKVQSVEHIQPDKIDSQTHFETQSETLPEVIQTDVIPPVTKPTPPAPLPPRPESAKKPKKPTQMSFF